MSWLSAPVTRLLPAVVTVVVESMFELFVVGASQSIRKTCEWSLLISAILSCVEHKWKYCVYVWYFQVYKDQQSVSIAFQTAHYVNVYI